MRLKLSFQKTQDQYSSIPLHHQHFIANWLEEVLRSMGKNYGKVNFSSFKGTSKVQNGVIRFLSTKITLVVSSPDADLLKELSEKIMSLPMIEVGKLQVKPRRVDEIPEPLFESRMKYVCISPLVPDGGNGTPGEAAPPQPSSFKFSDEVFHHLMNQMERSGYTPAQLDEFQVFGVAPDKEYLSRMHETGKKIARIYKDKFGNEFYGYLFPFTLHAHPDVHRFVWDTGLGDLNDQGYGMIDLADKPANNPS